MKAITTKYLGPTDTKGARVKAFDLDGNSVTVRWAGKDTVALNYFEAVKAFNEKYEWGVKWGSWRGGSVKGGMVWVCVHDGLSLK